jgi:hypothetical protein
MRSLNPEKKSFDQKSHLTKEVKNGYVDGFSTPEIPSKPESNGNGNHPSKSTTNPIKSQPSVSSDMLLEKEERGFWPVLKNQNFLVLWSGQVFSQLADKVYLVLMIKRLAVGFQP